MPKHYADLEYPTLAIGLMSGTSMDSIDGVLLSIESFHDYTIQSTLRLELPALLHEQLSNLLAEPSLTLDHFGTLNSSLGEVFADAANTLKQRATQPIAVIGCHGQTILHRPDNSPPFTCQLGNGALIAQYTGIPVVSDFRSADMAVGGQGAPLAPAFHRAVFSDRAQHRAIVNLGGIANITHLPIDGETAGFDTGPANTLIDIWCQSHFNIPFDKNGLLAKLGTVQLEVLEKLLADPYFDRPPPKSTGREYFNFLWLSHKLGAALRTIDHKDMLATLTALTAESVARSLNRLTPPIDVAYVCGGGAYNNTLVGMLDVRCNGAVKTTSEIGIEPQWVEAAAFAWMANQTLHRIPTTLPSVTGASKPSVAGAIYFPD